MTSDSRVCQSCKQTFFIEADDFAFYEKIQVPPPTWCPWCRMVRRMAFWNERSFFKRSGADGKIILSTYPQESPYKVIDKDIWWSDEFDATAYGRDYDFSRPFFEQLKELFFSVPLPHRAGIEFINSDYTNNANHLRNCYMCFNVNTCENCAYCVSGNGMKECIDMSNCSDSELCYDIETCNKCHKVFFAAEVDNSINARLIYDCDNVTDCFGCVGLRNAKYHIFNVPYSKEEYFQKLQELNIGSYASLEGHKARWRELMLRMPRKYYSGVQNVNVIGENVCHTRNAKYCYKVCTAEDVAYCQTVVDGVRDSYDFTNWGVNAEKIYESVNCGIQASNLKFCADSADCYNLTYCMTCTGSKDSFGCISMRKGQYCILNKQYSKEEYETLIPKIIQHMTDMPYHDGQGRTYTYGEFFPLDMVPFAANETALPDFTRMGEQDASRYGLPWRDIKPSEYKTTIAAKDLPDHIDQADEAITQEIIACLECNRAYRITLQEFAFFKEHTIPLPRKCHNCRYVDRSNFHNLPIWYSGVCQCEGVTSRDQIFQNRSSHFHGSEACPNTFETTYAPDRPEIIYCEQCYQSETA